MVENVVKAFKFGWGKGKTDPLLRRTSATAIDDQTKSTKGT
jgi:hypothetical protein